MRDGRPDPDLLLKEVQAQEGRRERGRLKVFLGASAGVGKTYAMLSEAHEQKERGVDVVKSDTSRLTVVKRPRPCLKA